MTHSGNQCLKAHKEILQEFWLEFGAKNKKGEMLSKKRPSPKPKEQVLQALKQYGKVKLYYNSSHSRSHFNKNKDKAKFQFDKCFACSGGADVRHHIIWIKNGGRNQKNNVIGMCHECHAEVHPWLKKEKLEHNLGYMTDNGIIKFVPRLTDSGELAYITVHSPTSNININRELLGQTVDCIKQIAEDFGVDTNV